MKKLSIAIISFILLIPLGIASAVEGVTYDFDDIQVTYAAEFIANPINIDPSSWIAGIAGGADKPINVLYGVVKLKKTGFSDFSEEFIKVSGQGGSERFLVNSAAYDYYEGTTNYKDVKSFFWSAKKLINNSIVKDFTPPIKSITLYRGFSQSQQMNSATLFFSDDGQQASQDFWSSSGPQKNFYKADTNTLNQTGIQTATVSNAPVATSDTLQPTATFTVNGSDSTTINDGDKVIVKWFSTNADTYPATIKVTGCVDPDANIKMSDYLGSSNSLSKEGSDDFSIGSAQLGFSIAGCDYAITYFAKNTRTGEQASATVHVKIKE